MSQDISVNKKRIAKNTIMLYIRMLLSTVVSLYTSRVVLNTLGVEDFGIYGLVGGVVGMLTFLNASMSGATSRFLTYEMGKGNLRRMKETFSSALIIHIGIALIILVLAETIGLWFMANKLVIPEERMFAAHCVYQLSILSMAVGVTQVPYNASIIAHEKMDVYAYVEILNVTLKLMIVYLLLIGNFDKLILYAILTLAVSITIAMVYRIYCVRKFEETHFQWVWNKDILKGLLSFSTYNLYGNMGKVVNTQGISFVINHFFGVVLNSAASIAATVSGVVNLLSSNIMTAFRPVITKSYACGDMQTFQNLLIWAIKIILSVYVLIGIPMFVEMDTILHIWLNLVPSYTSVFCKCLLVNIFFETLRYILIMGLHATGKVKLTSLYAGTFFILNPLLVYILLSYNATPKYVYYSIICINVLLCIQNLRLLKIYIPDISLVKCVKAMISVLIITFVTFYFIYSCSLTLEAGILRLLLMMILAGGCVCLMFYIVCLDSMQRQNIHSWLKLLVKKNG